MDPMGKSMPVARAPRDQMRFGFNSFAQVSESLSVSGWCTEVFEDSVGERYGVCCGHQQRVVLVYEAYSTRQINQMTAHVKDATRVALPHVITSCLNAKTRTTKPAVIGQCPSMIHLSRDRRLSCGSATPPSLRCPSLVGYSSSPSHNMVKARWTTP